MRKVIGILLFALSVLNLKVTAQSETVKIATIESINTDGTIGTLRDPLTNEIKQFMILNAGHFNDLTVGAVISYLAIQDEGKGFGNIIRSAIQDEGKGFGNIIRMAIQDEGKGFSSLIR